MKTDPKTGLILPSDAVDDRNRNVVDPRMVFTRQTPDTPHWGETFIVEPVDVFHNAKRGQMYLGYGGVILTLQSEMLIAMGRNPNTHFRRGMNAETNRMLYEKMGVYK